MAGFNLEVIANSQLGQNAYKQMWAIRNQVNGEMIANGLLDIPTLAFQELDKQALEYQSRVKGAEIVEDLNSVVTAVDVGVTLRSYTQTSDIDDSGAVTMDGNEKLAFDNVEYGSDGDPIPVFSDAYGVNWRKAAGMNRIDVNIILDSQRAKAKKHAQRIVNYTLEGNDKINVNGKQAQGLKNHRATFKVDLGTAGAGIDLTKADLTQYSQFFHFDLRNILDANYIDVLDVLWVSPQIYQNLTQKMAAAKGDFGDIHRSVMEYLGTSIPVRDLANVRKSYALEGNEFLGYVRDREFVEVPVAMPTTITPYERKMYNDNYNFRIDTIRGIQVKQDLGGRSGVFYGAALTK